jgi:hypothetical protein
MDILDTVERDPRVHLVQFPLSSFHKSHEVNIIYL